MIKTYLEMDNFRRTCRWKNKIDYYDAYCTLSWDDRLFDDENEDDSYEAIEQDLLKWISDNIDSDHNVYYKGDLEFEFEHIEDRDRFDEENGDPVAFKLKWT